MRLVARLLIPLFVLALPAVAASGDWPHPRGPSFDGVAAAEGALSDGEPVLSRAWRVPLGSGYSGIAVANGRAVTSFTDDEADWVAAFDVESGKRIWRHRLGDITKGHDGG